MSEGWSHMLRRLREERGLTQAELAARAGLSGGSTLIDDLEHLRVLLLPGLKEKLVVVLPGLRHRREMVKDPDGTRLGQFIGVSPAGVVWVAYEWEDFMPLCRAFDRAYPSTRK